MKFGQALEELEAGNHIAREGWNGKNQYVYMQHFQDVQGVDLEPCFVLHNAQGLNQPGWIPSIGDMRAADWIVLV